jgi:hypothetical protein
MIYDDFNNKYFLSWYFQIYLFKIYNSLFWLNPYYIVIVNFSVLWLSPYKLQIYSTIISNAFTKHLQKFRLVEL